MQTTDRHSRQRLSLRCILLCALLLAASHPSSAQTPQPTFEVASVKPAPPSADPMTGFWSLPNIGRFTASHVSLAVLMRLAYDIDDSQIANKPAWLNDTLYDVSAKPEDGIKLSREELRPRLQNLLQQRFHLVVHQETRMASGYALVVGKGGPHLTPSAGGAPGEFKDTSPGQMRGGNWTMTQLAKYLAPAAGFPVTDETGIAGSFVIGFSYNPRPDEDSSLPALSVALEKATGLVLKAQKIPVATLVIDSVDKTPTEN
jgi:uncharacterized protein (TIGR03435 family)